MAIVLSIILGVCLVAAVHGFFRYKLASIGAVDSAESLKSLTGRLGRIEQQIESDRLRDRVEVLEAIVVSEDYDVGHEPWEHTAGGSHGRPEDVTSGE